MREERQGILGLETEHVVLFLEDEAQPGQPAAIEREVSGEADGEHSAATTPPFSVIQEVLYECLLSNRKAALSSGIKGGYFLENGGSVHLEIYLHDPGDAPILEVATPECRSPRDVLTYSRAFDAILEDISRLSKESFRKRGYRGRLSFGKNNRDTRGAGFGCHENYLVRIPTSLREKIILGLSVPILGLTCFPVFAVFVGFLMLCFLWLLFSKAAPRLEASARRSLGAMAERAPRLVAWLRTGYIFAVTALLFPYVQLSSALIRGVVFRTFIRELTPFLVTRQIFAGSGSLDFQHGVFELSQRSSMTSRVANIVMLGRRKTVFDLKSFLFDRSGLFSLSTPLGLFSSTKRMSITVGDSNLSDVPNFLKTSITLLLIEMIESGESFENLWLHRPIRALQKVSADGPWRDIRVTDAKPMTSLEVQREYLRRAKAFFLDREALRWDPSEALALWEEILNKVADEPQLLASDLDWSAKKLLLDRAVLPKTNWKIFFAWGRLFELGGIAAATAASSWDDYFRRLSPWRRFQARRLAEELRLEPDEFSAQRGLHFQARKIDLRYHELGAVPGYQRALEADGLLRRIVDDRQVESAMNTPPQDTRARVRSYYIQQSPRPQLLHVNWNEIELQNPLRHIPTPDPFFFRLPTD